MRTKNSPMPADLYECYLLDMEEGKKGILALISDKKNRDFFLKSHKPISRKDFEAVLEKMKPKQRREFEQHLRTPYQQRIKESMRVAEQALHDYETDPKVRERVARKAKATLKKAMTQRRR